MFLFHADVVNEKCALETAVCFDRKAEAYGLSCISRHAACVLQPGVARVDIAPNFERGQECAGTVKDLNAQVIVCGCRGFGAGLIPPIGQRAIGGNGDGLFNVFGAAVIVAKIRAVNTGMWSGLVHNHIAAARVFCPIDAGAALESRILDYIGAARNGRSGAGWSFCRRVGDTRNGCGGACGCVGW